MILYVTRVEEVADNTVAVHLQPQEPVVFIAGQYGDFRQPRIDDPAEASRTFSFASAPEDKEIVVATRLSKSKFKQSLLTAKQLEFTGPMGRFVLPKKTHSPIVFLVGGIGITPVRSIIRSGQAKGRDITLIYANRTIESAAFHEEMLKENIVYIPVLSEPSNEWTGESGRITGELIQQHVDLKKEPLFYVVGPPAMVSAMKKVLFDLRIAAEHIRTEDFAGY